jgi:hypothetical protein
MTHGLTIILEDSIPLADSREIAKQLGIEHRSFFRMILEYQQEVEEDFGILRLLVKGFAEAREQLHQLERQQQPSVPPINHLRHSRSNPTGVPISNAARTHCTSVGLSYPITAISALYMNTLN